MEKNKSKVKTLTLELPADQYEGIIKSYAEKTGWTKEIALPKKQGKVEKAKNPLTPEQHVANVLQDRLISLNK